MKKTSETNTLTPSRETVDEEGPKVVVKGRKAQTSRVDRKSARKKPKEALQKNSKASKSPGVQSDEKAGL